ncbi:unnamed protein product [Clonostachys chloroleuca]|uniref:Uncharacterized protein n=1 Tax=Clonostachys chloroleuca TaxID=1926264 RepID=A0AA35M481_9HYPO|nr:unnamed protein product [Clonostachys chloroleuca]
MASSVTRENPDLYNASNIDGTNLDTAGVCWAFTGLAAGFLITRIIARVRWDKEMFGHDFWCIGGLTCSIISCAFLQIAMNSIDGEAFPYATAQQWRDAKFWQLMSLCVGALSASLPKLAIATFLSCGKLVATQSTIQRLFSFDGKIIVRFQHILSRQVDSN